MKKREEKLKGLKWPAGWVKGICVDCGDKFKPKMEKQGYCEPCRSFAYIIDQGCSYNRPGSSNNLEVFPGFMRLLLPTMDDYKNMAEAIGYSVRTIQHWSASGKIKGQRGAVGKVCKYLGMNPEELIAKCLELQEKENELRT